MGGAGPIKKHGDGGPGASVNLGGGAGGGSTIGVASGMNAGNAAAQGGGAGKKNYMSPYS